MLMALSNIKSAIGIVLAIAIAGYIYWLTLEKQKFELENKDLVAEVASLKESVNRFDAALKESEDTINSIRADQAKLNKEKSELAIKNNQVQQDSQKLRQILAQHRLEFLAANKPGLIETRVNRGTKGVLDELEEITSSDSTSN